MSLKIFKDRMSINYVGTCLIGFLNLRKFYCLLLLLPLLIAGTVFADGGTVPSFNPVPGAGDLYQFIEMILRNIVIPIGGVVAVMAVVYSGFLFVTAGGNPEKISKARGAFIWAVIGGLVLLGSWAIAAGIRETMDPIINP